MFAINLLTVLLSVLMGLMISPNDPWITPPQLPGFPVVLTGAPVEYASPVLGDLDRNGTDEIIVAGSDGRIYAVKANGALLWQYDIVPAFDQRAAAPAGKIVVASTPAVADLDGDGWLEVVVGAGTDSSTLAHNGGVIVLTHDGKLLPGWPQLTADANLNGYTDGVWSSPAVSDLDGDGKMEIVVGSFDHRVYVWRHDGSLLPGRPSWVDDTIWSSPALADLDKDGYLEIIIGSDNWGIKGGYLHAYKISGGELAGFPIEFDQTIWSSPGIGDINGDGWLDIVVGSGNYPFGTTPTKAVFAYDRRGQPLPGWPVPTDDLVLSSPTLGDINGDGSLEVIIGTQGGKVYAIRGNGTILNGWPVQAKNRFGSTGPLGFSSPILGNFDNDPQPEVLISAIGDIVVIDHDGHVLTHTEGPTVTGKPVMTMPYGGAQGAPAVSDINHDGKLEVIRIGGSTATDGNAYVTVWAPGFSDTGSPWNMWRRNAQHLATYQATPATGAAVVINDIPAVLPPGQVYPLVIAMQNTGTATWTKAGGFHLAPLSGDPLAAITKVDLSDADAIDPGQMKEFIVWLRTPDLPGFYTTRWRLANASGAFFGQLATKEVRVGDEPALYTLITSRYSNNQGVYAVGSARPIPPPVGFSNWWAGKSLGYLPSRPNGYYLLDAYGSLWLAGEVDRVGALQPWDPNGSYQQIVVGPQTNSYYLLNNKGNLYPSNGALTPPPVVVPSTAVIQSAVVTQNQGGVAMLDGFGSIYRGGNIAALPSLGLGADIGRRIRLTADEKGAYVLDVLGRVWNIGTAPPITPNYVVGGDWARDFDLTADGTGYYVLSKDGAIFTGGTAAPITINHPVVWPGQDVARSLVVADSHRFRSLVTQPNAVFLMATSDKNQVVDLRLSVSDNTQTEWLATSSQPWLSVTPNSGTTTSTPTRIQVNVQVKNFPLGTHQARITFSSRSGQLQAMTIPIQIGIVSQVHQTYLPWVKR